MAVELRWAAPDHASLVAAAVDVAAADGLVYLGRLLATAPEGAERGTLMARLRQGAMDADYPASGGYVPHLYHFHQPWTHRGYAGSCPSAAQVTDTLFGDALGLWRGGQRVEAAYELGRASHLVADCWIPYHAACVAQCGHGPYEAWLQEGGRWRDWAPGGGGEYEWQAVYRPADGGAPHVLDWRRVPHWVDLAAHESYPWYVARLNGCAGWWCRSHPDPSRHFPAAAASLVPGVIRCLAGFLHYFFTLAGVAPETAAPPGRSVTPPAKGGKR